MPRTTFVKKIVLSTLCFFSTVMVTQVNASTNSAYVSEGLNRLLANVNPNVHVGVVVQSMETGQILYSRNANHFFEPASVQKLFTVSSALLKLTPDYRFPTRVLSTGTINQGVLQGNLIFQFNGDPSLTQNNLKSLVDQLRARGIRSVDGNIIVDNTAYNHVPYPAGWVWSDLNYDFAAPLDTVIINRNQFGISLVPAPRVGEKPTIIARLPSGSATFYNEMTTTEYPGRNCPITFFANENNQYVIRGCLPKRYGTESRSLAVRNMEMFTKGLIRELLRQDDIAFHGEMLSGRTPAGAQLLEEHNSAPLGKLIVHLLKVSDNLYADTLLKKMGEVTSNSPGSWENGLQAMKPILANQEGVNLQEVHFIDGAGLSRYNLVTPGAISTLLHYIGNNPMLRETLIPALPIAGVDGTLAWRMPDLARGDRVHAKTGSMDGVATLAGFVKTANQGVLSFVIMINNVPKERAPYIILQNHIVEFLARM